VAVFGAVTACSGGLSPILWGLVLKSEAEGGSTIDVSIFQIFFLFVIAGVVVLSSLLARLAEDKDSGVDSLVIGNAIFRPFRAATYLVSLIDLRDLSPAAKSDETSPEDG
jgi:hypothetical protein